MPDEERSKRDLENRKKSDQSFKIWNPDGTLYAEMSEGEWIKRPREMR